MDIAQAKRKENIAEYILYLWQLEDLLRALQFSPEAIYSQLVAPREIDEEQKHIYLLWYMDIVNLLRKEGKEESGHLEHTLHLIADMHNLHLQLMQHPVGEHYRKTFATLAPQLPNLRVMVKKDDISDAILEDTIESMIAVIYICKGLKVAYKVVTELLNIKAKLKKGVKPSDYKSDLIRLNLLHQLT